ncbi:MAG: class I SAM-dependent methyltransferase [Planctomycetia bacterium]
MTMQTSNKETYWSRFADDFEERNLYVASKENIEATQKALADQAISGNVLELGCGNGTYSKILARTATHIDATDLSDEMVAASRERLKSFDNISVKKEDCFCLSYPDASFDSVVMGNLLHVIPEPEKAIQESKRVLKNGGDLFVISFTMEDVSFLNKLGMIYRYLKTYGKPPKTAQALTVEKTRKLLEDAGFTVKDARLIGNTSKAIFAHAVL